MAASVRHRHHAEVEERRFAVDRGSSDKTQKGAEKRPAAIGELFWVATALSFFAAYGWIHYDSHQFPEPKNSRTANPDEEFLEEIARRHLETLCSYGHKHVGERSNEVLAPQYILDELRTIAHHSDAAHTVDIDVQSPSGCFYLDFLGRFVNCYQNITNVIARISPATGARYSVLVNCHYDSSISSPGASDDVISCAMMLEILRVMSRSRSPFRHSVIFIFNGAEETILQGSHGFITQHKWAKGIRTFVNLEAAGSGGRELVFQTGPENPWLINTYAKAVPHPSASVVGQEIFQSGVIPSDTDFRIYRDFGGLPGMDIAYIYNGYIYHTIYDQPKYIPAGCIQRGGDNLLALVRALANSDDVVDPKSYRHGSMVFFDVTGLFMVIYSEKVGEVLNYFILACVVLSTSRKLLRSQPSALAGHPVVGWSYVKLLMCGWLLHAAATAAVLVTAAIMAAVLTATRPLCWYTNVWLIVPLYAVPAICSWALCHQILGQRLFPKDCTSAQREEVVFHSAVLAWTALLLLLTSYQLASAFMPMLLVAFPLMIRILPAHFNRNASANGSPARRAALTALSVAVPSFIVMYQFYGALILFVPLSGRSGSAVVPDLVIGLLVAILVVICSVNLAGLLQVSKDLRRAATLGYAISGIVLLIAVFTPVGFSYSGDLSSPTPQRHVLQYLHRQFYDRQGQLVKEDSGLFYLPFDYNGLSTVTTAVPELKNLQLSACDNEVAYCGWPYYFPMIHLLSKVYFMPLPHHESSRPVKARLQRKERLSPTAFKLHFTCTGHVHLNLYISPKPGVALQAWSFVQDQRIPSTLMPSEASDRPHYFVYIVDGKEPHEPHHFWLELKVPDVDTASGSDDRPLVDIGFGAHYLDGPDSMTPPLHDILARFPNWTAPLSWAISYQAFEV